MSTSLPWVAVVPAKRFSVAKSRLGDTALRPELAAAFLLDTVAAVLATPEVTGVVVVTDEPDPVPGSIGVVVVPDGGSGDVNSAVTTGEAHARAHWPAAGVVALAADLPALRPHDLQRVLAAASRLGRAAVPDVEGSGTTILTAAPGHRLDPAFGPGSYARHLASGAAALTDVGVSASRDVDVPAHLADARTLGLGRHTAAVVERLA